LKIKNAANAAFFMSIQLIAHDFFNVRKLSGKISLDLEMNLTLEL